MPDGWRTLLTVVAHPGDLEYGAASAVARWTAQGRQVGYLLATRGEAGIDAIAPAEAAGLREAEQRHSASLVGVADVTFLDHPDGTVSYGPELRRDIARHIRRLRPHVLLTTTGALTWGDRNLNQADHRAVALAAFDAARDAGNRWIFPELGDEGLNPWAGVECVYVFGSDTPTHAVDVSDTIETGIRSLRAHRTYLEGLGRDFDPDLFVRAMTAQAGELAGCRHAVALERMDLTSV
jgi:LmbE family N-acetylglucosaminyl deacetylase